MKQFDFKVKRSKVEVEYNLFGRDNQVAFDDKPPIGPLGRNVHF